MEAKTYTTSELFTLANQLRKKLSMTQKESFAADKAQLEASKQEDAPKASGRGHYIRDEKWKQNHAEKMRARWAIRHETETFKKREPNGLRGKYPRSEEWKQNHAEKMHAYWQKQSAMKAAAAGQAI